MLRATHPVLLRPSAFAAAGVACVGWLAAMRVDAQVRDELAVELLPNAACTNDAELVRAFGRHGVRAHAGATSADTRRMEVAISAHDGQIVGTLRIVAPSGAAGARDVAAASCGQVFEALAFVASVALATDTREAAPVPAETPDAAAPPPSAAPAATSAPSPRAAAPPARAPLDLAVGLDAQAFLPPAPSPLFALPVFVDASLGRARATASVRLRFVRSSGSTTRSASGGARFTWTLAGVDGCASFRAEESSFRGDVCARVHVGALAASGLDVTPSLAATRPWVDVGAAARGRWFVLDRVFLEAEASAAAPLVRDRFRFETGQLVFRPPTFGGGVAAGAGVQF